MREPWVETVLSYWFGLKFEQWWGGTPDVDADISERFLPLWEEQKQRAVEDFLDDPDTALAAVILFDQMSRNMFRGHADSFATDHIALAVARAAVDRGYDDALPRERRAFLYMPFQHSENLGDQQRSLTLFTELGDATNLAFAKKHHAVVERFGRFPHRNAVLGRAPRGDELTAGDVDPTRL